MPFPLDVWPRLRDARLVRLLVIYVAASWPLLEFTAFVRTEFGLPRWIVPAMILVLLAGMLVLVATAMVQANPQTRRRALDEEVPSSWELDLEDAGHSVARGRLPHLTWARALLGFGLALLLLFGFAGVYVLLRERGPRLGASEAAAGEADPGIAVLPFAVSGTGTEDLREGMVDLLSTNLDGVTGLRAIDSRTVLSRWAEAVPPGRQPTLGTDLDVARQAGARYALVGKAVSVGPQVRLIADVYDVRSGAKLGQGQVEGAPEQMLSLVDRLSVDVLRQILAARKAPEGLDELPRLDLARVTTSSLPALKAYLKGETLLRHSRFGEAIQRYQAAVEADSTFALAWYRLGTAHGWLEGLDQEHVDEFRRAADLGQRLPARERVLLRAGLALASNDPEALDLAEAAVEEYPEDAEAWYLLGDARYHLGFYRLLPRDGSVSAFRKAVALDPRFAPAYIHLLQVAISIDADSAAAGALLRRYHQIAGGSEYDAVATAAYELMWGGSHPGEVITPADTLVARRGRALASFLQHPSALRAQAELLRAGREHPNPAVQAGATIGLAWNSLSRGRLRELDALLRDPRLPAEVRNDVLLQAALAELPIPGRHADAGPSLATMDTTSLEDLLEVAAFALLTGRNDQAPTREARERQRQRLAAAGDTSAATTADAMLRTLD
ncbi:MAG: hypothetical protein H0V09_08090, partial [Gemmatimonadetes bacterium]|nr:hypothetical protein [Gemmatimonadota bacterium]